MTREEQARAAFRAWDAAKPANFYEDDDLLRAALAHRLGPEGLAEAEPALRQAGADAAGFVNRAAAELDRPEHLPRLEAWTAWGERVDEVVCHPLYHEVGRRVWRSGILAVLGEPGHVTLHTALAYLFALNGEVPHLCAVACTAGLIKALQRAGSEWMRRTWLPRLLERDYDHRWHGAQFLTEVQGGSDVGANACRARPAGEPPGAWRLRGEKWFCSNVSADLYAVSARPDGAPPGTAGLGLFVVERRRPDGSPNGVLIRRLKTKLGTRTLPTAEVEFHDALAWPLGRLEDGFKLLMGVIINTSRLAVATGVAGIMRRAWLEGLHYARLREAFGQRLLAFPAVRRQLAEMRALAAGALVGTLWVAAREDALTRAGAPPEDDPVFRTTLTLLKFRASADAARVVHHAMELLGGNGTIEDFSPLPRLYREVPVQESWEGPHNTLVAQLLRDAARAKMHDPFFGAVRDLLLGATAAGLGPLRERALRALDTLRGRFDELLRRGPEEAGLHARTLLGRAGRLFQVAALLELAGRPGTPPWVVGAARLLLGSAEPGWEPMDDPGYPELVRQLVEG
jgi:alkylation response protein AidB-like acyl-CoA dehydrogenase